MCGCDVMWWAQESITSHHTPSITSHHTWGVMWCDVWWAQESTCLKVFKKLFTIQQISFFGLESVLAPIPLKFIWLSGSIPLKFIWLSGSMPLKFYRFAGPYTIGIHDFQVLYHCNYIDLLHVLYPWNSWFSGSMSLKFMCFSGSSPLKFFRLPPFGFLCSWNSCIFQVL